MFAVLALIKSFVERNEYDVTLLGRVAGGDRAAFAELYDRYSTLVFTMVSRMTKSRIDAEDLLQDTFLQIWNKAETFVSTRGSVYTWIVTISRNKAIDRLRSADQSRRGGRLDDSALQLVSDDGYRANPLVAAISSEYENLMKEGLASISPEQRKVLEMSYFEGLTQSEISDRLELPLGTVKTRMRQGMIKIRNLLKERIET